MEDDLRKKEIDYEKAINCLYSVQNKETNELYKELNKIIKDYKLTNESK